MTAGPSQRSLQVMAVVRWALIIAVTAVASASVYRFWGPLPERAGVTRALYYCPMHPQITSPTPGECPICHMSLERIPDDRSGDAHSHGADDAGAQGDGGDAGQSVAAHLVEVTLTLDRQQLGGVASEPVRASGDARSRRFPAVVEVPEGARSEVRVRSPGFLERVAVRESGVTVTPGQPLAWIYSPQLFQTQQELLNATRWGGQPGGGRSADVVSASRVALELLGMSATDIDAMIAAGAPMRAVPLRSSAAATVVRVNAVPGLYATPDTALYELADLRRVWIVATVWERDLVGIHRDVIARFVTGGGAEVSARVLLVETSVSADSRAARVRMEAVNPTAPLRPGTYGEAVFSDLAGASTRLEVPRDAVIDTGLEQYVFVQTGEATFAPRRVRVGALTGDRFEVLGGITAGERVVSRGTFMVDSESRLRAALARGAAR
ncbi:MAG: efflux RND transporter periplasmic adaptor subunit [Polyangiales bacterium]